MVTIYTSNQANFIRFVSMEKKIPSNILLWYKMLAINLRRKDSCI
jgi:hypothetical protein